MKKIALFFFFSLILASCEKPVFPDEPIGDKNGNLVVNIFQIEQVPFSSLTRTESSCAFNRLNFAVYDSLGTRVKQVNQMSTDAGFGSASFQLEPGRYQVVVVAHSSDGNPTMTNPAKIQFKNNQGFTDTFLHNDTTFIGDSVVTLNVSLNRITSLCRFLITDPIPQNVVKMRFQYKGGSGAFDASTGLGCVKSTQTEFFPIVAGSDSTYYDLYTFLHDTEGTIHLQATAYDENNNVQQDREFDIPLKRRMVSKFIGPYFSDAVSSSINVVISIDTAWDGEEIIRY